MAGGRDAMARYGDRSTMSEPEAKAVLAENGVPVPRGVVVHDDRELERMTARLEFPLARKVGSRTVLHKSDVGGVRLGLPDLRAVREAMKTTQSVPGREGWLIEEMAPPGLELMVGAVRHPRFGPMLMVGLGGVLVELLNDVSVRICPVTRSDVESMLAELRTSALLDGVRGRPAIDRPELVRLLLNLGGEGGLLMRRPDLVELDVNPLIVRPDGLCAVDAVLITAPPAKERTPAPLVQLQRLLEPRAIAVVGASTGGTAQANQYVRNLTAYGYEGRIYPIHPSAEVLDGLPTFPSFAALPEPVDYAYVAIAAERCPALLAHAQGKVAVAQVMSGGFGEGETDPAHEAALVQAAAQGGVRIAGPNCMGTHSPKGKVTYMSGVDPRSGHVSVVAQSGGLSTDILRRGAQRGIRFRGLVTVGNAADLGPAELVDAFLDDDETHVLGFYIEDARRGRRLFESLRARVGEKPVVLLVGGRTEAGMAAAQSHTGALAGDSRAWQALATQTGCVLTDSLDEFLHVLLAAQMLERRFGRVTRDVVLFGNGGGTSVLATDTFARAGLVVAPLPAPAKAALDALGLPVGASVANPIDVPANVLAREDGRIARRVASKVFESTAPDAFVVHMNVPVLLGYSHADILGNLMSAILGHCGADGASPHAVLVLRADGEPEIEVVKREMRARALDAGIPVYDELGDAAQALRGLSQLEAAGARAEVRAGAGRFPGPPRDGAQ